MGLILKRKVSDNSQSITIETPEGRTIEVRPVGIKGNYVAIQVNCDDDIQIYRTENPETKIKYARVTEQQA